MSFYSRRSSHFSRRSGGRRSGVPSRRSRSFDPSLLVGTAVARSQEAFVPVNSFADFSLHESLARTIAARGYRQPTAIQDKVIPFYSALCIGGVGIYQQAQRLRKRPSFVIGTPGRLKDLEQRGMLSFASFTTIVLDEIDRMLDMGFIHDIEHIVSTLPKVRHSLFFSATLSPNVRTVMQQFLAEPAIVSVALQDTVASIEQKVVRINGRGKVQVLHELLQQDGFDKVLVFIRTKRGTDQVARSLIDRGVAVVAIHGNKNQNQRQRALEQFKSERIRVLLATDLASRGLDINNITHVINFDLPETYEDYVHRIGRTGRVNKKGVALTFVN